MTSLKNYEQKAHNEWFINYVKNYQLFSHTEYKDLDLLSLVFPHVIDAFVSGKTFLEPFLTSSKYTMTQLRIIFNYILTKVIRNTC